MVCTGTSKLDSPHFDFAKFHTGERNKELTPKEREVAQCLSDHPTLTRKEVFFLLGISKNTFHNHINKIREKLGLTTTEAIKCHFCDRNSWGAGI